MDAATPPLSRPYWLPEDTEFAALPRPLQVAITEILYPAYEQLVLGAADPLERATAATFVHLLWLELLQQFGARQLPRGPDAAQFRLRRA